MKYTAFIPARSGSKRLPGKNIKLLGGKPLIVWTLESFILSDRVNEVILSTDSMEYWDIARNYIPSNKLRLDYREPEQAGDSVKIFDYLKEHNRKIFSDDCEHFILALPTAPFRNIDHIDESMDLFESQNKAVFSAVKYSFSTKFAFSLIGKKWKPIFEDSPMITGNTRSQDQIKTYHPNGAIYIRSIDDLRSGRIMTLYKNAVPYIMDELSSVDIDNEIDFFFAESLIKNNIIK